MVNMLEGDPEFYAVTQTFPDRGGSQEVHFYPNWSNGTIIYNANSWELGYYWDSNYGWRNSITLRIMEEDGGLLGPDDLINEQWYYGLDGGVHYDWGLKTNIIPNGVDDWFTGGETKNCVVSLYWQ